MMMTITCKVLLMLLISRMVMTTLTVTMPTTMLRWQHSKRQERRRTHAMHYTLMMSSFHRDCLPL
jgi:hypothetical protein